MFEVTTIVLTLSAFLAMWSISKVSIYNIKILVDYFQAPPLQRIWWWTCSSLVLYLTVAPCCQSPLSSDLSDLFCHPHTIPRPSNNCSFARWEEENHLWKQCAKHHEGNKLEFKMELVRSHKTPLNR